MEKPGQFNPMEFKTLHKLTANFTSTILAQYNRHAMHLFYYTIAKNSVISFTYQGQIMMLPNPTILQHSFQAKNMNFDDHLDKNNVPAGNPHFAQTQAQKPIQHLATYIE